MYTYCIYNIKRLNTVKIMELSPNMLFGVETELGSVFSKMYGEGIIKDLNEAFVSDSSKEVLVNLAVSGATC